ncbi:MAG: TlpA family protein disulfide reductase [Nitrospirales bacterium]
MSRSSLYDNLSSFLRATVLGFILCLFMLMASSFVNPFLAQSGSQVAPAFNVTSLNGEHFSNFKLEGERALLMFWAPWCGVCQRELPKIARFYQRDMPDDLQVLTIGSSASLKQVEQYVDEHPRTFVFPTAHDANKSIAENFNIRAFPTYILLDEDGTILLVRRGGGILNDQRFHQLTQ